MFTSKAAILFWAVLACVPLVASIAYFRTSPACQPNVQRVAVSLHGASIALLLLAALAIGGSGSHHDRFGLPCGLLCLVSLGLIAYSFWRFRGPKIVHLFQIVNVTWLLVGGLVGSMAVT